MYRTKLEKFFSLLMVAGMLLSAVAPAGVIAAPAQQEAVNQTELDAPELQPIVEPELAAQINAEGSAGYLIYFREKADLSLASTMDWDTRGTFVMETLQATAERTQASVRAYLDSQGVEYRAFWIDNIIAVDNSSATVFNGLLSFPEIEILRAHRVLGIIEPEEETGLSSTLAIEPNLTHVRADQVWNDLGITGEGAVVSSIDTGVRYTHLALNSQYRGNLGGGNYDHNYNWFDPYGQYDYPFDGNGHGSHTMGTMVGDDGGDNQIGMAPGADWMACRGCSTSSCGDVELLSCAEFIAAPWDLNEANPDPSKRPNVVNNSWGDCGQSYDPWYQGVVDSWHAAGVYPVFSNGNASNCGYPAPPGLNTVGNPARYGNVTGVGSTGRDNGLYATHSNWGPTDNPDTVNPTGYPYLKPQVLAPGVSIRSSVNSSDTSYALYTGTSMSAPHVAGLVALMYSASPVLMGDYATTENLIESTAVPIPYDSGGDPPPGPGNVPNYATGWGEIDAYEAVLAAIVSADVGTLQGTVTDLGTALPIEGAEALIESADYTFIATTDAAGFYTRLVPEGVYTVTISAYGYYPEVFTGVEVILDGTTTQDAALEAAPTFNVSGTVTDSAGGWPLYAMISIDGYPGDPIWTDPVTGQYSINLVGGTDYTVHAMPFAGDYEAASQSTGVLSSNMVIDFSMMVDALACEAPGYYLDVTGVNEPFNATTTPPGWTVIDNLGNGQVWRFDNPGGRSNNTGGSGNFAIVDSDWYGSGNNQDTEMWTPVMDLTSLSSVLLEFDHQFDWYSSGLNEKGDVDVSNDGGATWTNVWSVSGGDFSGHVVVDITALAAGQPDVMVRFHYYDAEWEFWWQVDNVFIGEKNCLVIPGGLTVGNVYDANTNAGLIGATVDNGAGGTFTTVATPADPNVDDGFYLIHSVDGDYTFTASRDNYAPDSAMVTVPLGGSVEQDFWLGAGWLTYTPEEIEVAVTLGDIITVPMTLENQGVLDAGFELMELDRGSIPFGVETEEDAAVAAPPADSTRTLELSLSGKPASDKAGRVTISPNDDIALVLDDGSAEDSIGLTAGGQFIWLNRFTPDPASFPFSLSQVQLLMNNTTAAGADLQLVIFQDADGDPTNGAEFLYAEDVTVQFNDLSTWNAYDLASPVMVSGPGDVLVGVVNRDGLPGLSDYPAAIDQGPSQYRSWVGIYSGDPPDPPTLPPDADFLVIDDAGLPGNWTLRAYGFTGGGDVVWLSTSPITGTVPAMGTQDVMVTLDSTMVEPGVYDAQLSVGNDTPYSVPNMPIRFIVNVPFDWGRLTGTVSTPGYCDNNPEVLAGVEVFIEDQYGGTYSEITDEMGMYSLWMPAANSPLTVTVDVAGYEFGYADGVMLYNSAITTLDFDLLWLQPCISSTPDSLSVNLNLGSSTSRLLRVINNGAGDGEFWMTESNLGGPFAVIPASDGDFPTNSAPTSMGRAPVAPTTGGGEPTVNLPFAGEPAYAFEIYPNHNLVSIPDTTMPGTWNVIAPAGADFISGADFLNGDFTTLYAVHYYNNQLIAYDTASGAATVIGSSVPGGGQTWSGLTGAPDGTLYASATTCSASSLYTIDPNSGAVSTIGAVSNAPCLIDIAINAAGEMYGVDIINDVLVRIDPATGAGTVVGSLGFDANYAQGMDFEEVTGVLYLAAYGTAGELRIADTTTGNSVFVGSFPGGAEVDGLAFATSAGGGAGDVPWLSEMPESGMVAPYSSSYVSVYFDANQVAAPGEYRANLHTDSNDPVEDRDSTFVVMNVTAPASWGVLNGTITSLGYCDVNPEGLSGAYLVLESSTGITRTIMTGADGSYSIWLDSYTNPYTLYVSADEHLPEMVGGITVLPFGDAVTVNVDMRSAEACVTYMPDEVTVEVDWGMTTTASFDLYNTGAVATPFTITEQAGGFMPMATEAVAVLVVNDGGFNTTAASAMTTALTNLGYSYTQVSSSSTTGIPATLTDYDVVFYAGVPSTGAEQTQLIAYMDAGGYLLVADNDFGYSDRTHVIYMDYFQATYVSDSGSDGLLTGVDIMSGINPNIVNDPYPDDFTLNGPDAVGVFVAPSGNWAGSVINTGTYKAVYFAWDYQNIGATTAGDPEETAVFEKVMGWLFAGADPLPWLTEAPTSGMLVEDTGMATIDLAFDSTVPEITQPGTYYGTLNIETFDAVNDDIAFPVTMIVNPDPNQGKLNGTVQSLGYCDANPAPAEDAQVVIEGSMGDVYTLTTDAAGYFQYWLFAGPYTMTVTADEHLPMSAQISVSGGVTTTQNIDLRWMRACVTADPSSLSVEVPMGGTATLPFTAYNTGAVDTGFEIGENQGGFMPTAITAGSILIVNDGGGNTTQANAMATALANLGYAYDIVSSSSSTGVPADMFAYDAVLWAGNPSAGAEHTAILTYLDGGGRLLVSDNDFGYFNDGTPLYTGYFQADYLTDSGSDGVITGVDIMAGITTDVSSDPFPDDFAIVGPDATGIFVAPSGFWAGSKIDTGLYKAVYLAYDFHYAGGSTAGDLVETEILGAAVTWMTFSDVTWISEAPITGTLMADTGMATIDVTFDASVPEINQPGIYDAGVSVKTADPVNRSVVVPVYMTVTAPATWGKLDGTVQSLGYCDANPSPAEGAQVVVEDGMGGVITLTTDAAGYYSYWYDESLSPFAVTVTAPEHSMGYASGIVVTGGVTTTVDFDLRWLEPCVSASPDSFDVTLTWGDSVTLPLEIINGGAAGSSFEIVESDGGGPFLADTPNSGKANSQVTIGDLKFTRQTANEVKGEAAHFELVTAPDATTITHSVSQDIIFGNSVSCNAGGLHTDNSYLRVFNLVDFGISQDFEISNVQIGIESALGVGGDQPVTMNLYTLDGALIWANMTLIGTADATLPDSDLTIVDIPVSGTAPAGSVLVVEFFTPSGQIEGNSLFVGSNNLGQTAPTYLAAADCGVFEPMDTADIGFPDMHLVMNVTGDVGGGDIPWLTVSPITGTVDADSSALVDVIFDSSVLTETGTYYGELTVVSDDPVIGSYIIPLTLTVTATYAMDVTMDHYEMVGMPGDMMTDMIHIENMGDVADSYTISLVGDMDFSYTLDTTAVGPLLPGEMGMATLTIEIPEDAPYGFTDSITVVVTSQSDPSVYMEMPLSVWTMYGIFVPAMVKDANW